MKLEDVKELTLQIWRYYSEHPEAKDFSDLPAEIREKVDGKFDQGIPLCSFLSRDCQECPIYPCTENDTGDDADDEGLFTKWSSAHGEEKAALAKKILEKIEEWEPQTERGKCEQWDLVDNAIFDLIEELCPSVETKIEWTTDGVAEARAEIRETLIRLYCEKLKLCTEAEFYP